MFARVGSTLALVLAFTAGRAHACDDPALSRAAAELLLEETFPSEGSALVDRARRAGSDLPVVHGLLLREGAGARRREFLEGLRAHAHAPLVCGEASSEGRRLVLAGAQAARLTVRDGLAEVVLSAGWREARLHARDGHGVLHQGAFVDGRAEIPSDLVEPIALQVVATGPQGPRPVAERLIGEPRRHALARSDEARSDEPVTTRVGHLRASSEVSALRDNRLLERVALRHAETICAGRAVAHVGDGGDPVERLGREGIRARHVGETAARARSTDAAVRATFESPSHRAALVDRRFTDVGVGLAERDGRTCLVVLLAAWPRAVPAR